LIIARDRADRISETFYNYPGVFKVIDTTENHADRNAIVKKVLAHVKAEIGKQNQDAKERTSRLAAAEASRSTFILLRVARGAG